MRLALSTGYSLDVSGHRRDLSKLTRKKKARLRQYTRFERYTLISFAVIQYLLTLAIILPLMRLSTYSATTVYNNGFTKVLVSGVFDSNNGVNDSATSFFLKICQLVFSVALPLMSTFAIAMTTISLISTVIYLTKPDTFDLIHDLNVERKSRGGGGKPFEGLTSFYKDKGFREFILSFCPDFKSYAYADAISQGIDGAATMQDFIKTLPKYIMIFGFCIIINNRALLDFIMEGGQVGASLFERLTYDHDYVEIVNNFLDEGRDYTPVCWDTKKKEGANKLTLYKALYNKAKTRLALTPETKDQRSTLYKTEMGKRIENIVNGEAFSGLDFTKEVFTVKCEYYGDLNVKASGEGVYTVSMNRIVGGDTGCIVAFTHTEDLVKNGVVSGSGYNTTYSGCWSGGSVSGNKFSISFDMSGLSSATDIPSDFKANNAKVHGTAKATITWKKDDQTGTVVHQYTQGASSGNTISVSGTTLNVEASKGTDSNSIPAGATVTDVSLDLTVDYGGSSTYTPSGLVWTCPKEQLDSCKMPG